MQAPLQNPLQRNAVDSQGSVFPTKPGSVLVVHDAFLFPGGGERVAQHLAKIFGAEIVTGAFAPQVFPCDFITTYPKVLSSSSFLYQILKKFSKTLSGFYLFATMPSAQKKLIFFSGQMSLAGFKRVHGIKILYCHTPPRLLYDLKNYYLSTSKNPLILKIFIYFYTKYVNHIINNMDIIICNSKNVQNRIAKFWGINNTSIAYPPCSLRFKWVEQGNYFISTARHDILKRVDVIIKAFLLIPNKKLIVTSTGSLTSLLKSMAADAPNITFTGPIDDYALHDLIGRCLATIYIPYAEDFGMSPIESMSAGKPVIGVAEGGLLETVIPGTTGWLLEPAPSPDALAACVRSITPAQASSMREACETHAQQFSEVHFKTRIQNIINTFFQNKYYNS